MALLLMYRCMKREEALNVITSDILRLNLGRHILGSSDQVYCVNEWMSHQIE